MKRFGVTAMIALTMMSATAVAAADYPAPRQSDWIARDFYKQPLRDLLQSAPQPVR